MAHQSSQWIKAQLTGKSEDDIIDELNGVIFLDPVYGDWQTADEYLSGNVRQKLREAENAAVDSPGYLPNVEALRQAQPKDLDASEIEVRLGATWIDKKYIQQFMFELLEPPLYARTMFSGVPRGATSRHGQANNTHCGRQTGSRRAAYGKIVHRLHGCTEMQG